MPTSAAVLSISLALYINANHSKPKYTIMGIAVARNPNYLCFNR